MSDYPEGPEPANLKFLRRLVTVLTVVMIGGLLTIVALFVIRFSQAPAPSFPSAITLPDGTSATAFTQGTGWYAVVTGENQILIFGSSSGELLQKIDIKIEDQQ